MNCTVVRILWSIVLVVVLSVGCQDTSQDYVVLHRDGRFWVIMGEPYQGGVHGLRGWGKGCIQFMDVDFKRCCAVLPENCEVMPAKHFYEHVYDETQHRLTTEFIFEQ